jgi:hypothetical protein
MDGHVRITADTWGRPEIDAQQVLPWFRLDSSTMTFRFGGNEVLKPFIFIC